MKNLLRQAVVLAFFSGWCLSQTPNATDPELRATLKKFKSSEWTVRIAAFRDLVAQGTQLDKGSAFPVSDAVLAIAHQNRESRLTLVRDLTALLEFENHNVSSGKTPATEEFSDYYADLIQAVTTLRDPSSLPVLIDDVNTGGMATNALASFGDDALSLVIRKIPAADHETRSSLYGVLDLMTEAKNLARFKNPESKSILEAALITGAHDSSPHIRELVPFGFS